MSVSNRTDEKTKRRRGAPLVWGASALAAGILVLGVTGTLSSWTSAVITNDTNTTKASDAVALSEAQGGTVCVDTATTADNTATCSTINKYGGTATTLSPGATAHTTTVTLKNTGTGAGALTLAAGTCTSSGGATGSTGNLCDQATVTVECPTGTTTSGPSTLNAFDAAAASSVANLAAGASVVCTLSVSLPSTAPAGVSGMVASQPLVWTLTAT
jgi:hypothetical protein